MHSTYNKKTTTSSTLSDIALQKISKIIGDRIGQVTFTAECADDVSREFSDIKGLVAYENPSSSHIMSLTIDARNIADNKSATIEFDSHWMFGGTDIRICARDDVTTKLRADLMAIVSGTRPWYAIACTIDIPFLALIAIATLWVIALIVIATNGSATPPATQSPRDPAVTSIIAVVFLVVVASATVALTLLHSRLFPRGVFLIGQEHDRERFRENVRWVCVIGFVVSMVSGVVLMMF